MKDELLDKVKSMITAFKTSHAQTLTETSQISQKLVHACNKIAKSWSGSFAGYHARLYYGNFETPAMCNQFSVEWGGINGIPDRWTEKTPEDIKTKIERTTENNCSIDELEKSVKKLLSSAEDLRTEIVIHFSSFPFEEGKEKELFARIEKFKFGVRQSEFIKMNLPKQIVSTFLGMRKYSTVRASANEFGGMMHQSPLKSTNDFSSKFLGSTMVELRLVNSLNSFEQRIS